LLYIYEELLSINFIIRNNDYTYTKYIICYKRRNKKIKNCCYTRETWNLKMHKKREKQNTQQKNKTKICTAHLLFFHHMLPINIP
jgi:uncharacterized membrane protein YbaN (DUF454 family)